jgi:hypothetical protein
MRTLLFTSLASLAAIQGLLAQANTVPGLDGYLYDIASPRYWGRRGAAYPGGEIGFSAANYMCNPGTVTIPWQAAMQPNHPKFGFMITRVSDGRMVQVSDWSYVKHAFTSINGSQGPCLPCQNPGTGTVMGIGCYDVYGNGNNGDRYYLGPPEELNPWLGTWNPIGSYFDRGDPMVAPPANSDGLRSLSSGQVTAFDVVKNRVTVKESELGIAGASYYYQIHLIHQGEALSKRNNNLRTRGLSLNWTGTTWTVANVGSSVNGSVLQQWTGSTYTSASNGTDDGQFGIAVKVTGPVNGFYHYEYVVQNIDNYRGGAAFRVPICAGARVQNLGFRDIDQNPLNNWTTTVNNSEIAFLAAAGNAHRWNQLFNFWFDCDAAPAAGNASIDQADPGAGALTVTVPTQAPLLQATVHLGGGCGTPAAEIFANGVPSAGNGSFALGIATDPSTPLMTFVSPLSTPLPLGSGCTLLLDTSGMWDVGFQITDGSGLGSIPIPVPAGLGPTDLFFQAGTFIPNPPVLGMVGLTNGLKVRFASLGCN